ncbi:hypothetical protein HMPREF9599_01233 [Cutibacterium acnes HL050PA2]|nr:hypothetical protein HMPREF9599_01233 [Cutibacterium acnes HL050PA2]
MRGGIAPRPWCCVWMLISCLSGRWPGLGLVLAGDRTDIRY